MLQTVMIARVTEASRLDERIVSAMMFGSFAVGEADEYSDIEFVLFVADDAFGEFSQRDWVNAVEPVAAYFADDFGHQTALFENGIRGEFHFMRASAVSIVESWQGYGWFPSLDAAILVDRTGDLSRHAQMLVGEPPRPEGRELVQSLELNLLNLLLLGANLLNRGEFARAWVVLGRLHEYMLKLVRLSQGSTVHWPTPSRALEADLSDDLIERYVSCTGSARPEELWEAYLASWTWSRELFTTVGEPSNVRLPSSVIAQIEARLELRGSRF